MKQTLITIICSILIVIGLAACGNTNVAGEDAEPFIERAEEVVSLLNTKQYEELKERFETQLRLQVSEDELKNNEPLIEKSGDFIEIERSSVEKEKNYYVVNLATKYSKEHRIFTIRFNRDMEIGELLVK